MDPMTEFYIKIACSFIGAGLVFFVMMKMQARKEKEAQRKFEMTLRSRGMSLEIENKGENNDSKS